MKIFTCMYGTSNCPTAAPTEPVPSTMPVTVAKDSACSEDDPRRPMSAAIALLMRFAGPPEKIHSMIFNPYSNLLNKSTLQVSVPGSNQVL